MFVWPHLQSKHNDRPHADPTVNTVDIGGRHAEGLKDGTQSDDGEYEDKEMDDGVKDLGCSLWHGGCQSVQDTSWWNNVNIYITILMSYERRGVWNITENSTRFDTA